MDSSVLQLNLNVSVHQSPPPHHSHHHHHQQQQQQLQDDSTHKSAGTQT